MLIAVGHAGVIVHPEEYLPVLPEHMPISMVHSLLARSGWERLDEPVPDGLITDDHVAMMREFDKRKMETATLDERERLERYRPDTGDD
ncbi:hypothetical protein [Actinomadura sp. HBU206391]|uniref:hypothetical protein n=1 Tax=Actinomadura sp. HBU206391 TaxID=2731692 RepID=UPI0016500175|nr:hypothetical protein [Actinomadura sp. HBU206391]MBC6460512.1 hypothetical protein [Actinomadura sp. HBU206391]